MSTRTGSVLTGLAIFLTAGLLWAHHSSAPNFDMSKVVTLTGAITKVDWKNPHIALFFDAKTERSQTETWLLTGGPPADLVNRKVSRSELDKAIGQTVTMALYRAKDGTLWGNMLRLSLPDGKFLCVGEGGCQGAEPNLQLAWFDRTGKLIETVGKPGTYRGVDVSPDGKRVAVHRHDGNGGDVWIFESGRTRRLTTDASGTQDNSSPIWSPDGSRIVFASLRNNKWGLYVKRADGAGSEELLCECNDGGQKAPMSWSPDGRFIVYVTSDALGAGGARSRQWVLPLTGDRRPFSLLETANSHAQISPDGKWIAYNSDETGSQQVYVKAFPSGPGKWKISTNEAVWPRWRSDGAELLFYESNDLRRMMAADIRASGSSIRSGVPRILFESVYVHLNHPGGVYHTYAVSSDGQRFLIPRPETPTAPR